MSEHVAATDLITDHVRSTIGGGYVTQVLLLAEYVDEESGEKYLYRGWNTDSESWGRIGMCEVVLAEMKGWAAKTLIEGDDDD